MSEYGHHRLDQDLAEGWVERFAAAGVGEIEEYLAKHAAFQAFLEDRE